MSKYPHVLSEDQTLDLMRSQSICRYGDGELKLILGRDCVSQKADPNLARDLAAILRSPGKRCLVGIPNVFSDTPKKDSWSKYGGMPYVAMYGSETYCSSFITRPDSAPWIDRPEYWDRVRSLWAGRDVTLVIGDRKSLREGDLVGARTVRVVESVRRDAYVDLDRVRKEIGDPEGPIVICLGPAATVLAHRLAGEGLWALDLGHIGMFMRHEGVYAINAGDLLSKPYRQTLGAMHRRQDWGTKGDRFVGVVKDMIIRAHTDGVDQNRTIDKVTVLDYGCGMGRLARALKDLHRVSEYDPGIPGKDGMPKPCEVVVCTDVLEHAEPDKLEKVIDHLARLTGHSCFLCIATRPANAVLPDGRNAHLIVENASWWARAVQHPLWRADAVEDDRGREVKFWMRRR